MYVNSKHTTSHRRPQLQRSGTAVQLIKYGQFSTLETHLIHNLNKVECQCADDDNDSLQVTVTKNCQPAGFGMWTTM